MKITIPSTGQTYELKTDLQLKPRQEVIVEVDQIIEPAIVLCDKVCPGKKEVESLVQGNIRIIRAFTPEDEAFRTELKQRALKYLTDAQEKSLRHGLEIKIIRAELSLDEKKLTFYFTAEGRVDFRSLVADMVGSFHKIIRLQQIGPRDEAKIYGGFGKCGRELCCASFLNNLESVTLEMANLQEMAGTKTNKITGCCGKLMCCLSYEADAYQKVKAKMPRIGSKFQSTQGEGKVVGHNILENKVILETADGKKIEVLI